MSTDIIFMRIICIFSLLFFLLFIISCVSSGINPSKLTKDQILRINGLRPGDKVLKDASNDNNNRALVLRNDTILVIKKNIDLENTSFEHKTNITFQSKNNISSISIEDIKIENDFNTIFFNSNFVLKVYYSDGNINSYDIYDESNLMIASESANSLISSLSNQARQPNIPTFLYDYDMYMISVELQQLNQDNIKDVTERILSLENKPSEHGIYWDNSLFEDREDFFKEPDHCISQ